MDRALLLSRFGESGKLFLSTKDVVIYAAVQLLRVKLKNSLQIRPVLRYSSIRDCLLLIGGLLPRAVFSQTVNAPIDSFFSDG